tara:strand:+ start:1531 stop:1737 length:207 start_codon:yes stop_codon:yes gene_type:complete
MIEIIKKTIKGLNNLKYPLLSKIKFSKKKIEAIGATIELPGFINQKLVRREKEIIKERNLMKRLSDNL